MAYDVAVDLVHAPMGQSAQHTSSATGGLYVSINSMRYPPSKAQQSYAGYFPCKLALGPGASHMTAAACLRRSQAGLCLLPVDVWSSMSTQAGLTLDDKRAVRSSSASLRRLVNAATTTVGPALLAWLSCLCSTQDSATTFATTQHINSFTYHLRLARRKKTQV